MCLHRNIWVYAGKIVPQGINLIHSQLVDKILLTVQVGRLDDVKIGNDQPADSHAGQRHGNGRTKPADTGNADGGTLQSGMHTRGVA